MDGGGEVHFRHKPLTDVAKGRRVRISAVWADRGLTRRLCDLGLPVGAVVEVVHRQGGGGIVVERHDTRLALGGDMARRIGVSSLGQGESELAGS